MPYHEVKQGDSLSSIADQYGFFWETVWNHPNNAALRETRKSPNVLMARDRVFIPDKRPKEESGSTGQTHTFRLKGVPVKLNYRLLDADDQPRAGIQYTLSVDGKKVAAGVTSDDGLVSAVISPRAKAASLVVKAPAGDETYDFDIGYLNPPEFTSGVQARLMNLGYYLGEINGQLDEQTEEAISHFQEAAGLEVTGELDEATHQALAGHHEV